MIKVYLNDEECRDSLFPFAQTRNVAEIRVGILTIREKWERMMGYPVKDANCIDQDANGIDPTEDSILYAANIIPSRNFIQSIYSRQPDYEAVRILQFPWHIFQWNDWALREDFDIITRERESLMLPAGVIARNPGNIFIEEGADIGPCWINAETGPVYIGKNAIIMEGAMLRGPVSIGEGAVVKMGAKIYGATTIGPYCIAGGEIKNSVMMDYSNKAHDGYLGDSVLGSWCNLGAGTSNSNLKNTAGEVKVWVPSHQAYLSAGMKCGLLMGDYSRCSINTSFNTGTLAGISANIFGAGLSPKYIPSFTWGIDNSTRYSFENAINHINNWKKLKQQELTSGEIQKLKHIFETY